MRIFKIQKIIIITFIFLLLTQVCSNNNIISEKAFLICKAQSTQYKNSISAPQQKIVNVTIADKKYVLKSIVAMEDYNAKIAAENTNAIKDIISKAGANTIFYFPSGIYYFNGAANGWSSTFETTAANQCFAGDDINSTIIKQKSTQVESTFRLRYDYSAVRDLSITSADTDNRFIPEYYSNSHKNGILLDSALKGISAQILHVNVNYTQQDLFITKYYRPFNSAVTIKGEWKNVDIDRMWITDTKNAININNNYTGSNLRLNYIDYYPTVPEAINKWDNFLNCKSNMFSKTQIVNCIYIGCQFAYIDTTSTFTELTIDHNYINSCKGIDSGKTEEAGLFIRMPGSKGSYSKNMNFTNNSCSGRSPGDGAFLYLQGAFDTVNIAENDASSGGANRFLYIRSAGSINSSNNGIKNLNIKNNYIRNYKNPFCLGYNSDPTYIEDVVFSGNQTMNEAGVEFLGGTSLNIQKARKINIHTNTFVPTIEYGLSIKSCYDAIIEANCFSGYSANKKGIVGINIEVSENIAVSANTLTMFNNAVYIKDSAKITLSGNVISLSQTGILFTGNSNILTARYNSIRGCVKSIVKGSILITDNGNSIS